MEASIKIHGLDERLKNIEDLIKNVQPNTIDRWITNDEFCTLLCISNKTAQTYRDKGLISFSQIGNKIYYKMNHVNEFLESNIKPKFNAKFRR